MGGVFNPDCQATLIEVGTLRFGDWLLAIGDSAFLSSAHLMNYEFRELFVERCPKIIGTQAKVEHAARRPVRHSLDDGGSFSEGWLGVQF